MALSVSRIQVGSNREVTQSRNCQITKSQNDTMSSLIPNAGAMSEFLEAFEVRSKLTDQTYQCRFSHVWNGIATRHSDTMDTKFFVEGRGVVVGLAHTAFVEFRERHGRDISDREASYLAALYLSERLAEEDEHSLYDVPHAEVLRLIEQAGIR